MYERIPVGENSFYMDCPCKVGIVRTGEREAVLIDSGSDKDAAKKVKKLLDAEGWQLRAIFNTHFHADHVGGNAFLQEKTGCPVYAPGAECALTRYPVLEPTMLYGGFAMKELHNKFLMAKPSDARELRAEDLPAGLEPIPLPGHSPEMLGFRTADDVVYLADCLASEETLEKYGLVFLYDVQAYLDTLERVKTLQAKCFVPAHAPVTEDILPLAEKNRTHTLAAAEHILSLLESPRSFEELLAEVFRHYGLSMNLSQYVLMGSTVKSYLSYLKDLGRVDYRFEDDRMLWFATGD